MPVDVSLFLNLMAGHTDGEISDVDAEIFELFSRTDSSQDLGMYDSSSATIDVCVGRHDLVVHQSPGVLKSDRATGTTGAIVWKLSVPFAEWIASSSNPLFKTRIMDNSCTVLELGGGVGIVALALAPYVERYIITDQEYMLKLVHRNLEENRHLTHRSPSNRSTQKSRHQPPKSKANIGRGEINVVALDWETDEVDGIMDLVGVCHIPEKAAKNGLDVVVACDCVFNESLVEPFVQTCSKLCSLRTVPDHSDIVVPTVCIIAQQLRSSDVFELWISSMARRFRLWRISEPLAESPQYTVHLAILRDFGS